MNVPCVSNGGLSLSIVIPTFERPAILGACLESLARQSSRDFQVIVVCNGSGAATYDIIHRYSDRLPYVDVVSFPENVWDWNDLSIYYGTIYRRGLEEATGDFVLFLSDDDALSNDFVERALDMFLANAGCVAFTGAPIERDLLSGRETPMATSGVARARPRIESGIELALRALGTDTRQKADIVDPGFGYVVKTSVYRDPEVQDLIWSGGYEVPQYLALLPQGLVAFDPDAHFYWGRHPGQTNIAINARIGTLHQYEKLRRRELMLALPLWQRRYGHQNANRLKRALSSGAGVSALNYLVSAHPYDRCVVWDLGRAVRRPSAIIDIWRTDAREVIFWILVPRALMTLFKRALGRLRLRR